MGCISGAKSWPRKPVRVRTYEKARSDPGLIQSVANTLADNLAVTVDPLLDHAVAAYDNGRSADDNAGAADPDAGAPSAVMTPATMMPAGVMAMPSAVAPALSSVGSRCKRGRGNKCGEARDSEFLHFGCSSCFGGVAAKCAITAELQMNIR